MLFIDNTLLSSKLQFNNIFKSIIFVLIRIYSEIENNCGEDENLLDYHPFSRYTIRFTLTYRLPK